MIKAIRIIGILLAIFATVHYIEIKNEGYISVIISAFVSLYCFSSIPIMKRFPNHAPYFIFILCLITLFSITDN